MSIKISLKKRFDNFTLDVQFETKSKRIGILGASGCGKSMTLRGIAGVQHVDEGYVQIENQVLLDSAQRINLKPQKRHVGYLFQNYALFPTMTVGENVMAGLHGSKSENQDRMHAMLKRFQLENLENHLPEELSGGQQQRVALARMMAYQPEVILLDEPFSALDSYLSDRLQQELLEMLKNYEGTVILVSHNRDEIYRFSDELLIMQEGKLICQGKTKEVFASPKTKAAARLTGCKNIAEIEKTGDHTCKIPDWNATIRCQNMIPDDATHIGYRAHEFRPIWGDAEDNCIPFQLKSMAELPFEKKYFVQGNNGEEICWFAQRDQWNALESNGLPDYLQIKEEEILFLCEN